NIMPPTPARLLWLARGCLARLGPRARHVTLSVDDLAIERRFIGAGNGAVTPEGEVAARMAAQHEGVALEHTYTAKCLPALLHHAASPALRGRPLLFWNTFSSVEPAIGPSSPACLPAAFRRFF